MLLRPGDRVAVVAPSGPVPPGRIEAGCALLRSFGLDVLLGAHVRDRDRYLAGRDEDRAADLQRAWCDPGVRAVICARGGYGSTRLLPLLDWPALAGAGPKLLHGSSDVTALHGAFAARLGVATSFGPMPAGDVLTAGEPDAASLASLRAAWFGGRLDLTGTDTLRPGEARGPVVGGNLSLLCAALGTPYAGPTAQDAIALLEDVGEQPYRVDRMLTQLLQVGWFDGVTGVVLGGFIACGDGVEETLAERLLPLGVPVLAGVDVGHGPTQLTVPLGVDAVLDAGDRVLSFA
ncbi:MAG: LD-carboxypeptidase [Streptosporangiales bacterium]|nr:LD-carboxypeptidase [Streptosporangiales bacterium]